MLSMSFLSRQFKEWRYTILLFIVLISIRLFVAEPFLVYGSSMDPTFTSGDYLVVDEISYKVEDPKRGEVIVFIPPYDNTRHFIKRIIGLPGETVMVDGSVIKIINDQNPQGFVLDEPYVKFQSNRKSTVKLKDNEYYVAGDNRNVSYDSRSWGPLPSENITGRAFLRLYPFQSIGILPGNEQIVAE